MVSLIIVEWKRPNKVNTLLSRTLDWDIVRFNLFFLLSKLSIHFFMCEECSTYGAQFKRMCIAVILCINDALWLMFSSFSIFLQISWKMAISRKKLSSSERTKNRGSIRHRPPPHPPLINNFLSYDDSCLPCGNNICLIRMFL